MSVEKLFDLTNKFEQKEQEPTPEKVVLLIRHPSPSWGNTLSISGEYQRQKIAQGKVEVTENTPSDKIPGNYTLVDQEGMAMTRHLADYLPSRLQELATLVDPEADEPSLDRKYLIRSSPIQRALTEAEVVNNRLRLGRTDSPAIPLPRDPGIIQDKHFAELPWIADLEESKAILERAKAQGKDEVTLHMEEEPEKVIADINAKLHDLAEGLELVSQDDVPVDLIFSHRFLTVILLWALKHQTAEGQLPTTVTEEDFPELQSYIPQIAFTSITELRKVNGRWQVESIGQTPHLENTNLRRASVTTT